MAGARLRRLLIVGLDGLNWSLVDGFIAQGTMPHLARLKQEGAWGPLTSVVPTQSASAWASFMTGQEPAGHGVFDFMVRQADGTYRHAKPDAAATLWHYLGRSGLSVGVLNFPATYPPDPVNGFLVSGMLAPTGRAFTHPAEVGVELSKAVPGYRIDVEWKLYAGRERALLHDLTEMTRQRARAACALRERYDPDCLAVAFIGPDRLQHALWRHLDPTHVAHNPAQASSMQPALSAFYAAVDEAVGRLLDASGAETAVLIASDHGFQPAVWQFRVDDWLAAQGWLSRLEGRSRLERVVRRMDRPWVQHVRKRLVKDISRYASAFAPGGTVDWAHTVAFNPWNAQQGVRLNVQGREEHGVVEPGAAYERLRDEIREALLEAAEPRSGQKVVDRVWKREEFSGPFQEKMPDLVFALRAGFAVSPLRPGLWMRTGWASGDHSLEGMFLAWGKWVKPGPVAGARLIDLAPTALYLVGQEVPAAMQGKVLVEALDERAVAAHPPRREEPKAEPSDERSVQGGALPGLEEASLTTAEQAELEARLRGLGYL